MAPSSASGPFQLVVPTQAKRRVSTSQGSSDAGEGPREVKQRNKARLVSYIRSSQPPPIAQRRIYHLQLSPNRPSRPRLGSRSRILVQLPRNLGHLRARSRRSSLHPLSPSSSQQLPRPVETRTHFGSSSTATRSRRAEETSTPRTFCRPEDVVAQPKLLLNPILRAGNAAGDPRPSSTRRLLACR